MKIYHWECFADSFPDKIVVAQDLQTAIMKVKTQVREHLKPDDYDKQYELEMALSSPPEVYELDQIVNV